MLAKSIVSRLFPAWFERRMHAELKKRYVALQPCPEEGNLAIPKARTVEDYYDTDIFHAVEKALDHSWVDDHRVTGISFHKDKRTTSKHEYIVLRCLFPGDAKPFYIRLERTHEPTLDSDATSRESSPSPQPSQRGQRQKGPPLVSTLKKGGYGALDQFQYVRAEDYSGANQLQEFIPRTAVTILDVAVLAYLLHADSPRYELLRRQCFWFSYMVYEILRAVFQAEDSNNVVVEGLVPVSSKEQKSEKALSRGKWIFPINNPVDLVKDRERLTAAFEVESASARGKVEESIKVAREKAMKSEMLEEQVRQLQEQLNALQSSRN